MSGIVRRLEWDLIPRTATNINWASPFSRGLRILDCGWLDGRAADSRLQAVIGDGATRADTVGGVARRGTLGKFFTQFDLSVTGAVTFFAIGRFVSTEANSHPLILKAGGSAGMTGVVIHGGTDKYRQYRAAGNTTSFSLDVVVSPSSIYEYAAQALTVDSAGNVVAYLNGVIVGSGSITGGLVTRTDVVFSTMAEAYSGTGSLSSAVDLLIGTVHDRAMSSAEVREFSDNPGRLFEPEQIYVPFASGGGSGLTVSADIGNAVAAGQTATVSLGLTANGTIGNAVAAGQIATVSLGLTANGGIGNAVANGPDATVSLSLTANAGIGNAVANGLDATVSNDNSILAEIGNAVANGLLADVSLGTTVNGAIGNAVAAGQTAVVTTGLTVAAEIGSAAANGLEALVSTTFAVVAEIGDAVAAGQIATVTLGSSPVLPQIYGADPDYKDYARKQRKRREELEEAIAVFEGKVKTAVATVPTPERPAIRKAAAVAVEAVRETPQNVEAQLTEALTKIYTKTQRSRVETAEARKVRQRREEEILLF